VRHSRDMGLRSALMNSRTRTVKITPSEVVRCIGSRISWGGTSSERSLDRFYSRRSIAGVRRPMGENWRSPAGSGCAARPRDADTAATLRPSWIGITHAETSNPPPSLAAYRAGLADPPRHRYSAAAIARQCHGGGSGRANSNAPGTASRSASAKSSQVVKSSALACSTGAKW
jgi:hypothetical protein